MVTEMDDDLRRRARRGAARRLGFYIHAAVYLVVNALLVAIDLRSGPGQWALYPLLGWGLGLAAHGIVALGPVDSLYERLVAREAERLRRKR